MKKYRVYIDNELSQEVNGAAYLENSQKSVIESILTNPNFDINEDLFKKYCDEYTYSYIYYEESKVRLEELYLGELVDRFSTKWNLNFSTKSFTVSVTDDDDDTDALFKQKGFERIE